MAHLGEKLIILNEILEGLLTRTHYLLNFERPDALNIDVEKVCQKIVRKFPESNVEGIEKVQGYNIFTDRSVEIMASLEDYYQHILVLSKFKSQALALLHEISSKILEFSVCLSHHLAIASFLNS